MRQSLLLRQSSYLPARSPGSPTIPVMVIIIVPELEFDDVESAEAVASILGGASLPAGSVDPCEKAPAKNRNTATTQAKHRNLTTRLNVPSSHTRQGSLNCRDLFSQKILFHKNTRFPHLTSVINVPSSHPDQSVDSGSSAFLLRRAHTHDKRLSTSRLDSVELPLVK